MEEYAYKAYDVAGRLHSGSIQAASPRQAAGLIAGQGMCVVQLKRDFSALFSFPCLRRQFWRQYVMLFFRQFSVMIKAGLPISEGIKILAAQEKNIAGKRLMEELYRRVQEGQSFADSLQKHPEVFPPLAVHLVRIGEVSGNLEIVSGELADFLEMSYKAREKLITLMIYPAILMTATLVVLIFLLQFILPTFSGLFLSLQAELPLPTRLLLGLNEFLQAYGVFLMTGLAAGPFLLWNLYKNKNYREKVDYWLLRLPLLGELTVYKEAMQFSRALSILLASGLLIDQALLILHDATSNAYMKHLFLHAHSDIQKGSTLAAALRRKKVFPSVVLELLAAGELTGELDIILEKIADFCRWEADALAERLRAFLEPTMVLLMGGIIGLIIFAIAMPVLDAMSSYTGF